MSKNQKSWEEVRSGYTLVTVICIIIAIFLLIKVKTDSFNINQSDLKKIENLIVSEKPILKETKGKRGRKWLEFRCVNNKSSFEISNNDYKCALLEDVINEVNRNDTISIKILRSDVEDFDKNNACEIHSLQKNKKEYIDIECRNNSESRNFEITSIILFSIAIMTSIVQSFLNKPKLFNYIDPQIIILIITLLLFVLLHNII